MSEQAEVLRETLDGQGPRETTLLDEAHGQKHHEVAVKPRLGFGRLGFRGFRFRVSL